MERLIAWGTGGGNLRITYTGEGSGTVRLESDTEITYTGEGSGTVRLESDTENLTGYPRSLTVTFRTTGGTGEKTRRLTVSQPSRKAYVSGGTAECKVSDNVLIIE